MNFRKYKPYFFVILFLILLLPNFLSISLQTIPTKNTLDEFDPKIASSLTSINALTQYVDSITTTNKVPENTLAYFNILAGIVRKRFYHGYSHYNFRENYIAAIAGKYIWYDLSAIVIPADIMKYPYAACSQQSIIMMEVFKQKGITYRKIGFHHHFAIEAKIEGKWYYFDTNKEPRFVDNKRESIAEIINKKQFAEIYKASIASSQIDALLGAPQYGPENVYPAPRGKFFHQVTKILSHFLWIVPFSLFIYSGFIRKK